MRSSISSSKLRIVVIACVFLCCVVLVDRALVFGIGNLVMRSEFRFSKLYSNEIDTDVVVMGNSRALHSAYAPELTEPGCFESTHLAYNGLSVFAVENLAYQLSEQAHPPKLVLLELSVLYSDADADHQLSVYRRRSMELNRYLGGLENTRPEWRVLFHLLDFNSEMVYRALIYLRRSDQSWISSARGNFVVQEGVGPPTRRYEFDDDRVQSLLRLRHFLDSQGVSLLAYVAPYHSSTATEVENVDNWWSGLEEVMDVYDLSRDVQLEDEHFSDKLHTNLDGARILNDLLIDSIIERIGCD